MAPPSSSLFLNWKQPAGRALEAALNRALRLDAATRDALIPLNGRSIAVRMQAPALALRITVDGERLRIGPDDGDAADLSVRGTIGGLLGQLPMFRRDNAPAIGKLRIEGDAELARRLQTLAQRFDPDWQRPFAQVFGDVLGVQIADALADALRHARSAADDGAHVVAEYLTEESRDIVAKAELNAFLDDVDALRDDVERLAARIGRLQGDAAR